MDDSSGFNFDRIVEAHLWFATNDENGEQQAYSLDEFLRPIVVELNAIERQLRRIANEMTGEYE